MICGQGLWATSNVAEIDLMLANNPEPVHHFLWRYLRWAHATLSVAELTNHTEDHQLLWWCPLVMRVFDTTRVVTMKVRCGRCASLAHHLGATFLR